MPILSERLGTNDRIGALKALLAAVALNGAIGIATAAILTLGSRQAMALFGDSFRDGALVLALMAWTGALMTLHAPAHAAIVASGRLWAGFFMNLAWAGVLFGAFSVLQQFGAAGLAGSLLVAYSFHILQTAVYVHVLFTQKWPLKHEHDLSCSPTMPSAHRLKEWKGNVK